MYNPEGEDVHTIANRLLKQFNTDFDAAKKKMGKDARDKQNKNKESCCAVAMAKISYLKRPSIITMVNATLESDVIPVLC